MTLKEGFLLRDVCGETVIVGEGLGAVDFGKLIVLNKTALWLWNVARELGDFTVDTLADRLCDEYDVSADTARADVAEIVASWNAYGLLD